MEGEDSGESRERVATPRGRRLPLNSRRLTAAYLRQLSEALGLSTTGSGEELRQQIEGSLAEREDPTIQVIVQETSQIETVLWLVDSNGPFLQTAPSHRDSKESGESLHEYQQMLESHEQLTEELAAVRQQLAEECAKTAELRTELGTHAAEESPNLAGEVERLQEELKVEKDKRKQVWKTSCEQVAEQDALLAAKDDEIAALQRQLDACRSRPVSRSQEETEERRSPPPPSESAVPLPTTRSPPSESAAPLPTPHLPMHSQRARRGKAPPVEPFSGENIEIQLEDWLPALKRASSWNEWSEEDLLLQLAGHLRGRALQEWNLLDDADKGTYASAVEALRARLDPGNKTLAAQDFRHAIQGQGERVADYLRRLERTFRVAYGRDGLATPTRDALLHSQLHEGLRFEIMRSPAVSGAQSYKQLCTAAKNEERRLAELQKRQQYSRTEVPTPQDRPSRRATDRQRPDPLSSTATHPQGAKKCYTCGKPGHLARDCRSKKTESTGRPLSTPKVTSTKQVQTRAPGAPSTPQGRVNPLDFLESSSEDEVVRQVRVHDKGSASHCVKVQLQGVPVYGIIDSGADISIIGGDLFRKVASVAHLKKRDFKKADKVPKTYDQKPFALDGRMDLDVTFEGKTMCTPIYVKMDAHDQLLLSEGVCRQLGVIAYHQKVERWRGGRKQARCLPEQPESGANVPTVRVSLIQSVCLLPHQSAVVDVAVGPPGVRQEPLLLVPDAETGGLQVEDALLLPTKEGSALVVVSNPTGCSCFVERGTELGEATGITLISTEDEPDPRLVNDTEPIADHPDVRRVKTSVASWRGRQLKELVGEPELLSPEQTQDLHQFLGDHHQVFCLEEHERGETSMLAMNIDTGDARPKKLPMRRMPFAVRREVAKQLHSMQQAGVIQPSSSPWASPVVMVRKRDGTHRFCVDYRELNAVTKPDTFPLPRIDDLLDQLSASRYFSTLDLASGYWQIRMDPGSVEKTAFVTPQGLYEFRVMPFGLTNAPGVFQRLMERVLARLNPVDGPDFVVVYIDDVLVFSRTLEEHLEHLRLVIQRIQEAGLKLKPTKCHFIRKEVEYLGHIITPEGLKTNPRLVAAVEEFPRPQSLPEVRRFLGLSSYYRRFIPHFSQMAQPLHALTRKGVEFRWTEACEEAMRTLKQRLVSAPVLAYPSFDKPFVLETDASIAGVGAVLSQPQEDGQLHPVAYASRSLSAPERNYAITELETLAVVWAITHFHSYLYGHSVTVYTDHSAVKAVLETPNPSGKHARWWTKVYGSGVKEVHIIYRSGKLNASADALSRSPQAPAPSEGIGEEEVQVAAITALENTEIDIDALLSSDPCPVISESFASEQRKDPQVQEIIHFLEREELPLEPKRARKIALQASSFVLKDGMLFYLDPKQKHRKRAVVPTHLQNQVLEENHRTVMGGHFSGKRMYCSLVRHWWWDGMYSDVLRFAHSCPECAIVSGGERLKQPPLHPIPVKRPFQIMGVDIMDLPKTADGNRHVIVFQDFLTKWPFVFPMPDQKAIRIVKILVEEIVPIFGVPEALLSDRGTNLLSHLMRDVCELLGIKKLQTTAYHPQCNGMVERFNRTLKAMVRKHAARFGPQWDRYLSGVVWAYRNIPHEATGEKPSFLLFGVDCRTPTEAALLPPHPLEPGNIVDYREEVVLSLSSARKLAASSICRAQRKYKTAYDRKTTSTDYHIGDWVLVKFPHEESGKSRKLSRPWHGPYRVISCRDPDVTVVKVYAPQDPQIQVHQSRVTSCPSGFPAGYYWYGTKRHSPGRPPKWVQNLMSGEPPNAETECLVEPIAEDPEPDSDSNPSSADSDSDAAEDEAEREAELRVESEGPPRCTAIVRPPDVNSRYTLRRRVAAPDRLMKIRSGRASSEGRVM